MENRVSTYYLLENLLYFLKKIKQKHIFLWFLLNNEKKNVFTYDFASTK